MAPTPQQIGEILGRAQQLARSGNMADAEKLIDQVLAAAPSDVNAINFKGMLRSRQGDSAGALPFLKAAADAAPTVAGVWVNLGSAKRAIGDLDSAERSFQTALNLQANLPAALDGLGRVAHARGDMPASERLLRQALLYQANRPDTLTLLGSVLCATGRADEGVTCLMAAMRHQPGNPAGPYNLAKGLQQAGRWDEAEALYRQVVAAAPAHLLAKLNLGNLLCETLRTDEGLALQKEAATAKPDDANLASGPILTLQYLAETTAPQLLEASRSWAQRFCAGSPAARTAQPAGTGAVRVLLVSGDFCDHPVAQFLLPWVRHHDRSRVTLMGLHLGPSDGMTTRLVESGLSLLPAVATSVQSLVDSINAHQPDVVIDLAGHTRGLIPAAVASSAAPVRLSMLGYPGTTGFAGLTGYVSDAAIAATTDIDGEFAEPLLRLPKTLHCWTPPSDAVRLDTPRAGVVRIGVVNNLAKVTAPLLDVIGRAAQAAPAVTWVFKSRGLSSKAARDVLLQQLAARAVPAPSVELHSWVPASERWAFLHNLDVTLDTFPYNGTTTTCETLWCGVPVLAVKGYRYASRVTAGLLKLAALDEWICDSQDALVDRIVTLSRNPSGLRSSRAAIRTAVDACPWRDEVGYARQMDTFMLSLASG